MTLPLIGGSDGIIKEYLSIAIQTDFGDHPQCGPAMSNA